MNPKTKQRFEESEWNWTSGDDFRTKPLIDFWQNDLKKIKNLKIIRYEDLCKHPVQTCKEVLRFLSIKKYNGFIEKVVSEVGVSIRHEYKINKEFYEPSCKELAEIWNYKT